MKHNLSRVYGLVRDEHQNVKEFNGEVVKITLLNESHAHFTWENIKYQASCHQIKETSFVYRPVIYINEGSLDKLDELEKSDPVQAHVVEAKISNAYARRGTHWLKFHLDPSSLIISGDEAEDEAHALGREMGPVVISISKLREVLQSKLPSLTESELREVVDSLKEDTDF